MDHYGAPQGQQPVEAVTLTSLRAILESLPDAMVVTDRTGTMVAINQHVERLFGYGREELLGRTVEVLLPARLRARHVAHRQHYGANPYPREMGVGIDLVALRKDETELPVEISLSPMEIDGAWHVMSAIRDATERHRAAQTLRFLAETSAHVADTLDYDGTLQAVARLAVPALADWCSVYVRQTDELARSVALAAADPRVEARLQALAPRWPEWAEADTGSVVACALRTGTSQVQHDVPGDDVRGAVYDEAIWPWRVAGTHAVLAVPLLAGQQAIGVLTFGASQPAHRFDRADVLLAEELARRAAVAVEHARLFSAEQRARTTAEHLAAEQMAILDQIADAVIIAAPGGHIRFANAAARRFGPIAEPGVPISAYSRLAHFQARDGQPIPAEELPLLRALAGTVVSGAELILRPPDGADVAMRCSASPVRADDGTMLGAVVVYHDVTAQRELDRQKDEFFANTSHDLRTPLATISAAIELVLANEPPATPEPVHQLLVSISAATARMSKLVEDLLELSRLQAGRARLQLGRCDLRGLVLHAVSVIEPLTAARGQHLERVLPREPVWITADAERLERAIFNLLDNARKYAPEGGHIRLTLESRDSEQVLSVLDDGPGISVDEQERIFDRFYQGRASSRNEGSGLGLPIARAMVELHGGRLCIDSTPGAGSCFTIALPPIPSQPLRAANARGR